MKKRLSIRGVMTLILLFGLGSAAIRAGSFTWLRVIYTLTVVGLLLAVLAAKYSRDAFWFGFAVFGWGYFLIGIGPWTTWIQVLEPGQGTILQPRVNRLLFNDHILEFLASYQTEHLKPLPFSSNATANDAKKHNQLTQSYINSLVISTGIGHLVWAWGFGLLGGLIARYLSARRALVTTSS